MAGLLKGFGQAQHQHPLLVSWPFLTRSLSSEAQSAFSKGIHVDAGSKIKMGLRIKLECSDALFSEHFWYAVSHQHNQLANELVQDQNSTPPNTFESWEEQRAWAHTYKTSMKSRLHDSSGHRSPPVCRSFGLPSSDEDPVACDLPGFCFSCMSLVVVELYASCSDWCSQERGWTFVATTCHAAQVETCAAALTPEVKP